jgi:hypothetical protein
MTIPFSAGLDIANTTSANGLPKRLCAVGLKHWRRKVAAQFDARLEKAIETFPKTKKPLSIHLEAYRPPHKVAFRP